jgi:hypothetical protein
MHCLPLCLANFTMLSGQGCGRGAARWMMSHQGRRWEDYESSERLLNSPLQFHHSVPVPFPSSCQRGEGAFLKDCVMRKSRFYVRVQCDGEQHSFPRTYIYCRCEWALTWRSEWWPPARSISTPASCWLFNSTTSISLITRSYTGLLTLRGATVGFWWLFLIKSDCKCLHDIVTIYKVCGYYSGENLH